MELIATLILAVLAVHAVYADDCQAAQNNLMGCFMGNQFDMQRAEDPAYREEMCRAVGNLIKCGEKAKEDCSSIPPEITQMLDAMAMSSSVMCSGSNEEGGCVDLMADIQKCNDAIGQTGASMCESYQGFKDCLGEVQERCEDHPHIDTLGLDQLNENIDSLLDILECDDDDKK